MKAKQSLGSDPSAATTDALLRVTDAFNLLGVSRSTGYARQSPKSRYHVPGFPPRVYDALGRPFVRLSDVAAYVKSLEAPPSGPLSSAGLAEVV